MTTIVAVRAPGELWIGGDRLMSVHQHHALLMGHSKVARVGPFLIGAAGESVVQAHACRTFEAVPTEHIPASDDVSGWLELMEARIGALFDTLRERHLLDAEGVVGGNIVVAAGGLLFEIDSVGDVHLPADGYAGAGSGWWYARAALWTARHLRVGLNAQERVLLGLRAAADNTTDTAPPFDLLSSNGAAETHEE